MFIFKPSRADWILILFFFIAYMQVSMVAGVVARNVGEMHFMVPMVKVIVKIVNTCSSNGSSAQFNHFPKITNSCLPSQTKPTISSAFNDKEWDLNSRDEIWREGKGFCKNSQSMVVYSLLLMVAENWSVGITWHSLLCHHGLTETTKAMGGYMWVG